MVGLLTFAVLFILLRIGNLKGAHKGLLLALLIAAVLLNLDKINVERYQTLTNLEDDYNLEGEGGRWDIWTKAVHILARRPFTGVGANNFPMAMGNYRLEVGVVPKWQNAHNAVVQILVEIGVIGGAFWVLLVIATAKTFWQFRTGSNNSKDDPISLWASLLFVGFIAQFVSSLFLSMGYSTYYTLFVAIATAFPQIAGTSLVTKTGGATTRRNVEHSVRMVTRVARAPRW
jgi:O-antigen ligase